MGIYQRLALPPGLALSPGKTLPLAWSAQGLTGGDRSVRQGQGSLSVMGSTPGRDEQSHQVETSRTAHSEHEAPGNMACPVNTSVQPTLSASDSLMFRREHRSGTGCHKVTGPPWGDERGLGGTAGLPEAADREAD